MEGMRDIDDSPRPLISENAGASKGSTGMYGESNIGSTSEITIPYSILRADSIVKQFARIK